MLNHRDSYFKTINPLSSLSLWLKYQNAVWFRHIAHTPLAEFNMYIPPEMVNIVIIWRFSVYIFRQINSFLYLCDEIAIKEVWTH